MSIIIFELVSILDIEVSIIDFEVSGIAFIALIESAVAAAFAESDSAEEVVAVSLQEVIIAVIAKIANNFFIFL